MKTSFSLLIITCTILLLINSVVSTKVSPETTKNTINAVLGDESYMNTFGEAPSSSITDEKRIITHLSYVEELLRNSMPNDITPKQKEQRLAFLDHLRNYRMAGNFPVNDDHPDRRRPTFISNNGNICAVGYLVEQSAGRAIAERINDIYKYSYINEIDAPEFMEWVEESGFTVKELAMIQPTYQSEEVHQNRNRIETPFILASGVALSANALYWSNDITGYTPIQNHNVRQWAGLAIGTGTMLFGALNVNTTSQRIVNKQDFNCCSSTTYVETNHLKTGLSTGHIIVGAATFLRSAWSLIQSSPQQGPTDSGPVVTNFTLPHTDGSQVVSGIGYRFTFN